MDSKDLKIQSLIKNYFLIWITIIVLRLKNHVVLDLTFKKLKDFGMLKHLILNSTCPKYLKVFKRSLYFNPHFFNLQKMLEKKIQINAEKLTLLSLIHLLNIMKFISIFKMHLKPLHTCREDFIVCYVMLPNINSLLYNLLKLEDLILFHINSVMI